MAVTGCKPEAPAETSAAGSPEEGPAVADGGTPPANADAAPADAPADEAAAPDPQGEDEGADSQGAEDEPETPPEPEPEFIVPEEPLRVLMLGDSLVATGIGALLEKKLDAHPHVTCFRKGKSSSGLARPDFYDWYDQARAQIEFRKPDLVIVILGGNDGQDLTRAKNGRGRRVNWDTDGDNEAWAQAYRERMDQFVARLSEDDRTVLWIGLPHMGLRSLEKKLDLIRPVQKAAIDALGDQGVYFDTVPFTTKDDGSTLKQAKVGTKSKLQDLRTDDGIHFTMAGSEYLADLVYPSVLETLRLADVQPDP